MSTEPINLLQQNCPLTPLDALSQSSVATSIISNLSGRDYLSSSLVCRRVHRSFQNGLMSYYENSFDPLNEICPEIIEIARRKFADESTENPSKSQLYKRSYEILKEMTLRHKEELAVINGNSFLNKVQHGFSFENAVEMYNFLKNYNLIKLYQHLKGVDGSLTDNLSIENLSKKADQIRVYLSHNKEVLANVKNLILKKQNFTMVPSEIELLTGLTFLDFSRNYIQVIPLELCKLAQLAVLNIEYNEIQKIPPSIIDLMNLFCLDLNNNQIQTIPPCIGEAYLLQNLVLYQNQIRDIPPSIGKLENLIELNLSNNKVQSIPDELKELTTLRILDLGNNGIVNVPPSLENLKRLNVLQLAHNPLAEIPPFFEKMKARCTIYVS